MSAQDSCRDLSGRRLRHVNAHRTLGEWERGREAREAREAAERAAQRRERERAKATEVAERERSLAAAAEAEARAAVGATADAVRAALAASAAGKRKRGTAAAAPGGGVEGGAEGARATAAPLERPQAAARGSRAPPGALDAWAAADLTGMSDSESEGEGDGVADFEAYAAGAAGADRAGPSGTAAPAGGDGGGDEGADEGAGAGAGKGAAEEVRGAAAPSPPAPIDVSAHESAAALLAAHGADALKAELRRLGLKCGGAPLQRAERLMLLRTCALDELPREHFAGAARPAKRAKGACA